MSINKPAVLLGHAAIREQQAQIVSEPQDSSQFRGRKCRHEESAAIASSFLGGTML